MTELPVFSAIPTPETQIGLAVETERGVPVAPTLWLPVMGPKYKPDLQLLPDEGLRGSMVTLYDEVPGLRFDSHGFDIYPYLDTFPALLRACLGSKDTKTAKPAAATTLEAEAAAGASEITVTSAAEITEGKTYVVIGTAGTSSETRLVTKVTAKKLKLAYPLGLTHANGATVTGLTTHEFSLLNNSVEKGNQPPSYTITDFAGEEYSSTPHWRQLAAAQLDSLSLTGSADALPKATTAWMANAAIKPSTPSPSFSTVEAPPGWTVTAALGGSQVAYLVSWGFDLKRSVKNIPAITGNQNYYQHFAGALDATAKIVVLENPEATWINAYAAGELESIDLTLADVASGYALNLHSSKCKFTTGEIDRSKEWVEVPLDIQLIPSTADALAGGVSPIKAAVANGTTTEF
jgi:Phage tail tube protein